MLKRFKKSNLYRFLGHEAVADEVINSHAYGKVAKSSNTLPVRQRVPIQKRQNVGGYRDSMVGSIAQYRDRTSAVPIKPQDTTTTTDQSENIIGNRPKSGTNDTAVNKDDASINRRHHFIEPPKRNFNRFD